MWVKASSTSGARNLFDEGGTGKGYAMRINDGQLEGAVRNGGSSTQVTINTAYPVDGAWHHVALVFNNGVLKLYLDGTPSATQSTGLSSIQSHDDPGGIGSSNNVDAFGAGTGSYFEGLIDDARLYDVALDDGQVQEIYNTSPMTINFNGGITHASCNGSDGAIQLSLLTGETQSENFSIKWSNGESTPSISGLTPGLYTVTVSQNNLRTTKTFVVNSNGLEKPEISLTDGMLTSSKADTYQWFKNDEPILNATHQGYLVNEPGSYSVQVANENGCQSSSDPMDVDFIANNRFMVYPNPSSSTTINLELYLQNEEEIGIAITDLMGRSMLMEKHVAIPGRSIVSLDLSSQNLSNGVYMINVKSTQILNKTARLYILR